MNGPKPKRYPWSWALLPQEGRFQAMILPSAWVIRRFWPIPASGRAI
jgi:hypothetical protein